MSRAGESITVDIEALARTDVRELTPYVPGKPIEELERELGITNAIKLASNENPLGPSPVALAALEQAARDVNRYPEGGAFYLRQRLAEHLELSDEQIAVGAGSNELIELLCHIFVAPGDEVVVGDVTFPMYLIGTRITGGTPVVVPLRDLSFDLPAMADAITERTRIVFIANPNNPTGTIVRRNAVEAFLERVPDHVLVVFDEAYFEYVEDPEYPRALDYLEAGRHVCILRTFSKAYSLAGLRVGYAITQRATVGLLNRVRMPFNVPSVAQAAARAALDDQAHVARGIEVNRQGMQYLTGHLTELGWQVHPSHTNFLLVSREGDARPVVRALEQRGIIVRGMRPFGLGDSFVRISVGVAAENERLIAALRELG